MDGKVSDAAVDSYARVLMSTDSSLTLVDALVKSRKELERSIAFVRGMEAESESESKPEPATEPGDAIVELDADLVPAVQELHDIRAEKAELAKREKQLRDELLDALGRDRNIIGVHGGEEVVRVTVQRRTTINRKRLQALHPDVHDEVLEESESVVLQTSKRRPESRVTRDEALGDAGDPDGE